MREKTLLIVLVATALLGTFHTQAQTVDDLKKCVTFVLGKVHVKGPDGTLARGRDGNPIILEMPIGTAFFVSYPHKYASGDFTSFYAVTAKHVLQDVDGTYLKEVRLRVNLKKPGPDGISFETVEVPVTDSGGRLLWFEDKENPENDVAVLPFLPDKDLADFKADPVDNFVNEDLMRKQSVTEGDVIFLFGLMPQYYGDKKNYPIVRRGSLALLTDESIPTATNVRQHVYLAEMGSWPGNSGAPVFLNFSGVRNGLMYQQGSFFLLGVMLGYFKNERPAEVVETRTVFGGDPSNIGISYILPASEIRKVLESPLAQQRREAEVKQVSSEAPSTPKP